MMAPISIRLSAGVICNGAAIPERLDGAQGYSRSEDARDAVTFGADGIVVSNHGGRQLDGALSDGPGVAGGR
jgi:hypothetical protein